MATNLAAGQFRVRARLSPSTCLKVFAAIKEQDETLDQFALAIFQRGFDSNKGQTYHLPEQTEIIEAYASLDLLRAHAKTRLADPTLTFPTRAAWMAIDSGQVVYGVDGTFASR